MFDDGEFDVCSILYNRFKSVISQIVTVQQLVPYGAAGGEARQDDAAEAGELRAIYEYEPDEEDILAALLPRNLAVQVYRALLESAASATRNAGDMIDKLTLNYNRSRQAAITKELIEIVTGAEAL